MHTFKKVYTSVLLRLLPHLINVMRIFSRAVAREVDYLPTGYTFQLTVSGTSLSCVCRKLQNSRFKRVPPKYIANDVEPGSGLATKQEGKIAIDYVINFRSLDYAFHSFSGKISLKSALAERAFSTRGPNDTGAALTYMFTALLRTFFFWRSSYARI